MIAENEGRPTVSSRSRGGVLHLIDSQGMYGAERVVLTLLQGLKSSPHRPILGCITESTCLKPELGKRAEECGIEVVYFPMFRGFNPSGIYAIVKFMENRQVEAVHTHGYKPTILLGLWPRPLRSIRLIATVHGWAKADATWKGKVYELLEVLCLQRMDQIVAVSDAVRRDLKKRGLSDRKVTVIYNGINSVDLVQTKPLDDIKHSLGLCQNQFVVVSVGRLSHTKGHMFLIEGLASVVKRFPNVRLLLVGEGPLLERLRLRGIELQIERYIKFVGYRDDVPNILAIADVFALPSNTEGLPIALLEALSMKKAVVATNVGGIPEVVTQGDNAALVPPRDSRALGSAIIALIEKRNSNIVVWPRKSSAISKRFNSMTMITRYIALYNSESPK